MNQSFGLQVLHTVSYLHGEVAERRHGKARAQTRLLQALEERAQRCEFRDEHERIRVEDDAVETNDVLVVDRVHDRRFLQELDRIVLHALARQAFYGHLDALAVVRPDALLYHAEFACACGQSEEFG